VDVPDEKLAVITLNSALNAILMKGMDGEKVLHIAMSIGAMVEAEFHLMNTKRDTLPMERKYVLDEKKLLAKGLTCKSVSLFKTTLQSIRNNEEWKTAHKVRFSVLFLVFIFQRKDYFF
jgi:DNA-directed RNA polymerase